MLPSSVDREHPSACPFCDEDGATVQLIDPGAVVPRFCVVCHECGAQGPPTGAEGLPEDAIVAWNRRFG